MHDIERVTGTLDHTAELLKRVAEVLAYATVIFTLLCLIGLVGAGFYGIVHPGNDFGADGGNTRRDVGDVGDVGDVIVLPRLG